MWFIYHLVSWQTPESNERIAAVTQLLDNPICLTKSKTERKKKKESKRKQKKKQFILSVSFISLVLQSTYTSLTLKIAFILHLLNKDHCILLCITSST